MRLLGVIFALIVEVTIAKATYNLGPAYHGPPAPLSKDGKVIDTPEVAHAKAAHFAAYHHIASKLPSEPDAWTDAYKENDEVDEVASNEIGHGDHGDHGHYEHHDHHEHHEHHEHFPMYHGPPAPLGHDGRVVDTDEVARAKAAHMAALEHAKALAAKSGDHHHHHHHQEHHHEHEESALVKSFYHVPFSYHGPSAPLAHDGRVIDTPEVAKARDAHLHAFAHAKTLFHHP